MSKVQEEFNSKSGDYLMSPGEYEGPLTVSRPCVVDGCMSTLWANKGPVLVVDADGVTVKNLRVEVTGELEDEKSGISIKTNYPDTLLENVEVNGSLAGFTGEAPSWSIPSVIPLGVFAADRENTFSFELEAPMAAELSCCLSDIKITPQKLIPGKNRITIKTASMRDNTILYGEVMLKTGVTRRIYVTGKAVKGAPEHHELPPVSSRLARSEPVQVETPREIIAPVVTDTNVTYIKRGQRLSAGKLQNAVMKVAYEHRGTRRPLEIDAYVFLLQKNGKVRNDQDLIFFGNQESEKRDVKVSTGNEKTIVFVELEKTETWVDKIAVCLSVYGDDAGQNFSLVDTPIIRVFDGEKELYRFALSEIKTEKTVVALEIYRYKGEWKLNFVGAGYHSGLKKLCESYGVEVE